MSDDIQIKIGLNTDSVEKGIGAISNSMSGLKNIITTGIGFAFGQVLVGGIHATTDALGSFVKSAMDSENVTAQLNAVLKSTGGAAGVTSKAAQDLATSLQSVTKYSDEEILSAENMLLTFTEIGKDIFPQVTEAVLDMSDAMHQDAKSSAIQLGKALNGLAINSQGGVDGLSALQRIGIKFTKSQEEMIKKYILLGKKEEAQKIILAEIAKEMGGSARAAGETFAGQLVILQNTLDDLKEKIGGAVLPVLQKFVELFQREIMPVLTEFVDAIAPKIKDVGEKIFFVFADLVGLFKGENKIAQFALDLGKLAGAFGLPEQAITDFVLAFDQLRQSIAKGDWGAVFDQISGAMKTAWDKNILPTLQSWGGQFWEWLTGKGGALETAGTKLKEFATGIGTYLAENGPKAWAQLQTWATEFWEWLTDDSEGSAMTIGKARIFLFLNTIANELETAWEKTIVPTMETLGKTITDFLKTPEIKNDAYYAGVDLGNSIADGIIEALRKQSGEGGTNNIFAPIDAALKPIDDIIRAAGKVADEFVNALVATLTERGDEVRAAVIKALSPLMPILDNLFGKEPLYGAIPQIPNSTGVVMNPSGFGAGGGVGSVVVMIDGQEIKNATAQWTFGQVQSLFADATAAVGSTP